MRGVPAVQVRGGARARGQVQPLIHGVHHLPGVLLQVGLHAAVRGGEVLPRPRDRGAGRVGGAGRGHPHQPVGPGHAAADGHPTINMI